MWLKWKGRDFGGELSSTNLIICCSVSIILRISGSFEANLAHHLFLPIKVTYFCSVLPGEGSKTQWCSNDAFYYYMNVLFLH